MSNTDRVTARFEIKALNETERTFEGLASTWALDLGDDRIHRGAFKAWLSAWHKSKKVLPLIDQHNYGSVRAVVGKLVDAKETAAGLWTKFEIARTQPGSDVLELLRSGMVDALSIGYRATKWDKEDSDEATWGQVRNIHEVELREISVVIFPMNEGARVDLDTVKQLSQVQTRTLSRIRAVLAKNRMSEIEQTELLERAARVTGHSLINRVREHLRTQPRLSGRRDTKRAAPDNDRPSRVRERGRRLAADGRFRAALRSEGLDDATIDDIAAIAATQAH